MNKVELYKLKSYYYNKLNDLDNVRKNIVFQETYEKVREIKKLINVIRFKYKYYDLLYRKEKKNEILERENRKAR